MTVEDTAELSPLVALYAYLQASPDTPPGEFWPAFREAWEDEHEIFPRLPALRGMLTSERLQAHDERCSVLLPEEQDWFVNRIRRGKPVRIYRGGVRENIAGFSWTTDIETARYYALLNGRNAILATGLIPINRVILRLQGPAKRPITRIQARREKEVLVFPEHVQRVDLKRYHEFMPQAA